MDTKVFFLIDAFSSDYLSEEETPFLYECAKQGEYTQKIIPGLGFCERAEIFTGIDSKESGYISAIGFNPNKSPYKKIPILLRVIEILDRVFPIQILRKILRRLLAYYVYRFKHPLNPYRIPYRILKYFSLTEDYNDMTKPNALRSESIFDIARLNSKKIHHGSFTGLNSKNNGTDNDRLKKVLNECSNEYSLYLIYISVMDSTGHKYGPESIEVKEALNLLDRDLMNFVDQFEKKIPGSSYVFLGDHGMVQVEENIDIQVILRKMDKDINVKFGSDYIYFLDSTMLRIWMLNEKCDAKIRKYIMFNETLKDQGVFSSQLNDIDLTRDIGDIVWCANSGVLISPDFFHSDKEKILGMHGYLNPKKGGSGMCIRFGNIDKKIINKRKLHEVFNDLVSSVK